MGPFVGGSQMQCVRAPPSCAPEGQSCGWNNDQMEDCCDGMQCKPFVGGSQMQCVRAPPSCAPEGQSCGWNNAQTRDCCDDMVCKPFVGGSNMQCVKKQDTCVAQGEYCGGPGQRTLECCSGTCQYPPNSNTMFCKDVLIYLLKRRERCQLVQFWHCTVLFLRGAHCLRGNWAGISNLGSYRFMRRPKVQAKALQQCICWCIFASRSHSRG